MRQLAPALLLALACSKTDPKPLTTANTGTPLVPTPTTSQSAAAPVPSAAEPSKPRNVLLVTIDSLRADMPYNGYSRNIAPNLAALADKCTTYQNAYSVSSYTAKSVAAFLSGQYPSTLYRSGFFFASYANANQFMAETLHQNGIATLGWFGHLYFTRAKGLEQGFDEWRAVPGLSFDPETDNSVTSDKMTALGIELLGKPELKTKQFFAWGHYGDPHDVYNPHEEAPKWGHKARDKYDQEVFYTDLWVKKLLDFVDQQAFAKDTYLIISADHGEAFGEHGMYKHAFELWDVLTHVPLIICGPGIKAQRITERRSHIDLVPTMLDLLGQKPDVKLLGKSLVPELTGQAAPQNREPIYLELTEDSHNPPRRAIIRGDYKLIWSGPGDKFQLFDLKQDPAEEKDVSKTEPEALKDMISGYHAFWDNLPMVEPYGNMKLHDGGTARGPTGPQ